MSLCIESLVKDLYNKTGCLSSTGGSILSMSKYIESEKMKLKVKYTDTICKEIVAFLNTDGGKIIIGVDDTGKIVGVNKVDETLKKISDIITSQIEPNPQEEIQTELKFESKKTLIILKISKGVKNIYCQKKYGFSSHGCVMRIGTTCKEMTSGQIKVRYEKNFYDDEYMIKKSASRANLSFKELKFYYADKGFHLEEGSFEVNFNLKNKEGKYNLLAELLADKNSIPFNFVKFNGLDKAAISERSDYGYRCILSVYEKIMLRLSAENICISDTTKRPRHDEYLFDYNVVNEAVLNALVHNDWTITEPQISMFQDRMEILSHGGLPKGLSISDFYKGISHPRNVNLMRIFLNMGLVEHTGHGVPTIINKYGKKVFEIKDNYIKCKIPFNKKVLKSRIKELSPVLNKTIGLNKTEREVLKLLLENSDRTTEDISKEVGVTKRTIERSLVALQKKGKIERIGSKKAGKWSVIQ